MKPHEAWLGKSRNDLESARRLIEGENPLTDTAIYHTQQCAEKALKAFLNYRGLGTVKTHDLRVLVEHAMEKDSGFTSVYEDALSLNPFSTAYRYPDIIFNPKIEEVREAIQAALRIFDFVSTRISSGLFER